MNANEIVDSIESAVKTVEEAKILLAEAEQIQMALNKAKGKLPLSHPSIQNGRRRFNEIADHPAVVSFRKQEAEERRFTAELQKKAEEKAKDIRLLITKSVKGTDRHKITSVRTHWFGKSLLSGAVILRKNGGYITVTNSFGEASQPFPVGKQWKEGLSVPEKLRPRLTEIGWILPNEWHDSTGGEKLGEHLKVVPLHPTLEKTAVAS